MHDVLSFSIVSSVQFYDLVFRTPLHFAAATNSQRIAQLLLAHGADVNAVDAIKGSTPLHYAAKKNAASVGQLLMLKGANATSPGTPSPRLKDILSLINDKDDCKKVGLRQ